MQLPLEIAARNVKLTEEVQSTIRARAAKLDPIYKRITSCRVAVDIPHRHRRTGSTYLVRIDITVPGSEIVVKRKPREILLTAIQDAFDAAERQLRRFRERRRGDVKTHESPQTAYDVDAELTDERFDDRAVGRLDD